MSVLLTLFLEIIFLSRPARLRASSRGVAMMEPGAAPAPVRNAPHAPGRRRDPAPGHDDPGARSSLSPGSGQAKARPRAEINAAMEHREARALRQGRPRLARRGLNGCAARRSIPSLCARGRRGTTAYPAPPTIRAAERWLF